MRAVKKGGGHHQLNNRHAQYLQDIAAGTATTPERAWRNFGDKEATRDACWHEQFGLCAYSEIVLDDQDLGMHIDHVEPKSLNRSRTFEHGNLLLSAISDKKLKGMPKQEVFGGHFRLNLYSDRLISSIPCGQTASATSTMPAMAKWNRPWDSLPAMHARRVTPSPSSTSIPPCW
jgi:hypothetical protein